MNTIHRLASSRSAAATLALLLVSCNVSPTVAQPPSRSSDELLLAQYSPPPPPSRGTPEGRGQGGGSRGPCEQYSGLTALVPIVKQAQKEFHWSQTTVDRPVFWFYAPEGLSAQVPVELALRDGSNKTLYKTTIKVPQTPAGVFSLSLPATAPALQAGQVYRWSLSLYCDPQDTPVSVEGAIKRVNLPQPVQQQLSQAKTPVERAALYAKQGIWQEGLTTLGQQRVAKPNDPTIAAAWAKLLRQVNLEQTAAAAIVPCCRVQ